MSTPRPRPSARSSSGSTRPAALHRGGLGELAALEAAGVSSGRTLSADPNTCGEREGRDRGGAGPSGEPRRGEPPPSSASSKARGVPVLDRSADLDIFAQHARSRKAAQVGSLIPPPAPGRQRGSSRLGGGIGTRGPGETKQATPGIRTRLHELRAKVPSRRAAQRGRSSRAATLARRSGGLRTRAVHPQRARGQDLSSPISRSRRRSTTRRAASRTAPSCSRTRWASVTAAPTLVAAFRAGSGFDDTDPRYGGCRPNP